MKILLVDDNIELNNSVKQFLELKNYDVDSLYDGKDVVSKVENEHYDLLIIDIQLPKQNGLEILKKIREKEILTPIIMITALEEIEYLIESFEKGSNEFIKKPFHLKELEIRIKNVIKKELIKIDKNFYFDSINKELILNDKVLQLRKKEKLLLSLLFKNLNRVVETEKITHYVWNKEKNFYPLRQLISTLKKRVPEIAPYIETIHGVGYKLNIE